MAKSSSKKDRSAQRALMKPFEVLAISFVCGVFVLGVVLLTLQNWVLGLIFGGIAMVVVLLVLALLLLSYKPNPDVPVYLDRHLYESKEPGAQEAALRPLEKYDEELPREEEEREERAGKGRADKAAPEAGRGASNETAAGGSAAGDSPAGDSKDAQPGEKSA